MGKILNSFDRLLRYGLPTFEAIRLCFQATQTASHLSSLLKSYDCTNNYFGGHNVFAAHDLVLEVIQKFFILLHILPPHCLHSADLLNFALLHSPFSIDALNHINKVLAFQLK